MRLKGLAILVVAFLAVGMLSYDASADGRNPGSCLLYPYYNTGVGNLAVMTITNTGDQDVVVRLVWVDSTFCSPEDQWIELTPGDTFSFVDGAMNPQPNELGFMYAYAVDALGSINEIDYDYLIGQEIVFATWNPPTLIQWAVNAVAFNALAVVPDGDLHLDGTEYDAAPKCIYFPRFFGQSTPNVVTPFLSYVIFINLTGGQWFLQQANVLVYNDNEQAFSSTVNFPCWLLTPLVNVSFATTQQFLLSTNHDIHEIWDGIPGVPPPAPQKQKAGWIEFVGQWAWNPTTSFYIENPSLYAVLIETLGGFFGLSGADLPWQTEDSAVYNNAMLYSTSPWGN